MKKKYKIIIIISLCILMVFMFTINTFAFNDIYVNYLNEPLYKFRLQNLYQKQDLYTWNYYFCIWTKNNVVTDYSNYRVNIGNYSGDNAISSQIYIQTPRIDFNYNSWQLTDNLGATDYESLILYSLLSEFDVTYQEFKDNRKSSVMTTNIVQGSIGKLFLAGRYIFYNNNTTGMPVAYSSSGMIADAPINYYNNGNDEFYYFTDSLFQALRYSAEISNSNTSAFLPSNLAFTYSQDLRDQFCISLYNLLYYEFNRIDLEYQDILDSIYGKYASTDNDISNVIELYMNNNEVYANKITGNMASITFTSNYNGFNNENITNSYYFYTSSRYFFNGVFLNWIPNDIKALLLVPLTIIIGLSIAYAIKHLIFN